MYLKGVKFTELEAVLNFMYQVRFYRASVQDPFCIVSYNIKWVITSWTYSTVCMYVEADPGPVYIYDICIVYIHTVAVIVVLYRLSKKE